MRINRADVAELVDARDLKFPAGPENTQTSCKTSKIRPADLAGNPAGLQNNFRPPQSALIALRNAHKGGNPAVGAHCNLLLKQLDNHKTADPESRPMLAGLIRQTMTELSNLLPGEK